MDLTSKDLEKLISFHLSDDEYDKYVLELAKRDYMESLDPEYQAYLENFKKSPADKKHEVKKKYMELRSSPDYDDGMKNWNEIGEQTHVDKYIVLKNDELKKTFTELQFNTISLYNNIKFQHVIDNPHLDWDWCAISGHNNVTFEMIKNNDKIPWNYEGILSNKNIGFDELVEYVIKFNNLDKTDWVNEIIQMEKGQLTDDKSATFNQLLKNKGITVNDIMKYKELPWDYYSLSLNCNITWDFVLENIDEDWDWDLDGLFSRPTNSWDDIKKYGPLILEDWDENNVLDNFDESTVNHISTNPNITWNIIANNMHENWDWSGVTVNPNITMKIINDNPSVPWDKNLIYKNKSISFDDLVNNNITIGEFQKYQKMFGFQMNCFDF